MSSFQGDVDGNNMVKTPSSIRVLFLWKQISQIVSIEF